MDSEEDGEDYLPVKDYVALADFSGDGKDQLRFRCGDRLLVHAELSAEWWWAELRGVRGYVPASYLREGEAPEAEEEPEDPWQDEEYFGNYGTLKLHLEMLSDKSRTEAYRQVILGNRAFLKNKVVTDLGCGTGIISLFCAQLAQPSTVALTVKMMGKYIAVNKGFVFECLPHMTLAELDNFVEASSMANYTRQLVKQNGFEDTITVLQGRIEEIQLPQQVDVLVSEWMGNCLLFEFMVESVVLSRDRWLRDGGVMWPSSAALSLVPCQADTYYSENMSFWDRPYGLDFTPLQLLAQQEFFTKPKFSHIIEPKDCLAPPCDVLFLDMYTLQVRDLEELKGHFHFCVEKSGTFHGFTAWFTVYFESLEAGDTTVELNTGPNAEPTHWKQTLFMLDTPVSVCVGDSISGDITVHRNHTWRRHMTVTFEWTIKTSTEDSYSCQGGKKSFPMWR